MIFMKTKIIVTHKFNSQEETACNERIKQNIIKMWKRGIFHEKSCIISSTEQRG